MDILPITSPHGKSIKLDSHEQTAVHFHKEGLHTNRWSRQAVYSIFAIPARWSCVTSLALLSLVTLQQFTINTFNSINQHIQLNTIQSINQYNQHIQLKIFKKSMFRAAVNVYPWVPEVESNMMTTDLSYRRRNTTHKTDLYRLQ